MINFSIPVLYLMISVIAILLSCFTILFIFGKIDFFKLIAIGITIFINVYIICACVLAVFDRLSIENALMSALILHIVILMCILGFCRKKNRKCSIRFNVKDCIIIVSILLVLFPFVYQRNGYFCMSQDEGAYFVKAMYFIEGQDANIQKLEEYDDISDTQYKDFFVNAVRTYSGGIADPLIDLEYVSSEKQKADYDKYYDGLYGRFHAVPTFSAVMAFFGVIFGEYNIGYLNLIFFFIYLILIYYILKNLKIRTLLSIIITFSCGIVPNTIWCQKSYLTEMYLGVLMIGMLLFLTEKKSSLRLFAVVYFGTLCYYHVTAFVFIPLVTIIYFFLFLWSKEKCYLKGIIYAILFYYIGFNMLLKINPAYIVSNYNGHLSFMNIWSIYGLWALITFLCCILFIFILSLLINAGMQEKMWKIWEKHFQNKLRHITIGCTFILIFLNVINMVKLENWQQNCLVAYIFLTGIFIIPFSYLYWFKERDGSWEENKYIVSFCYMYAILLLSIVVKSIMVYYYAARYLMPYIAFVFIFAAIIFNEKKYRYWFNLAICIMSIEYMFAYDAVVMKYQDDTSYQMDTLNNLRGSLQKDDIVIIESVDHHSFGALYALFRLEEVHTYPLMDNIDKTLNSVNRTGKRYLYMCHDELMDDDYHLIMKLDNHVSQLKDYTDVFSDMLLNSDKPEFYHNYIENIFVYEYSGGGK